MDVRITGLSLRIFTKRYVVQNFWTTGLPVRIGPVRYVVRIFSWSGTWSGFWSGFFLVRYVVRNSVRKSAPGRIIRTGTDFGPDFKNNEKIKKFWIGSNFQAIFKSGPNSGPDHIPDRTESWSGPDFGPNIQNVQKFLFDQKSFQMSLVRD